MHGLLVLDLLDGDLGVFHGLHGLLDLHGLHGLHGACLDTWHGNSGSSGTTGEVRNGSKLGKLRWLHVQNSFKASGAGSVKQIQSSWSWLQEKQNLKAHGAGFRKKT